MGKNCQFIYGASQQFIIIKLFSRYNPFLFHPSGKEAKKRKGDFISLSNIKRLRQIQNRRFYIFASLLKDECETGGFVYLHFS